MASNSCCIRCDQIDAWKPSDEAKQLRALDPDREIRVMDLDEKPGMVAAALRVLKAVPADGRRPSVHRWVDRLVFRWDGVAKIDWLPWDSISWAYALSFKKTPIDGFAGVVDSDCLFPSDEWEYVHLDSDYELEDFVQRASLA